MRSRRARLGLFTAIAMTGCMPGAQLLRAQNPEAPSPKSLPSGLSPQDSAKPQETPDTTSGGDFPEKDTRPGSFTPGDTGTAPDQPAFSRGRQGMGGGMRSRNMGQSSVDGDPMNPVHDDAPFHTHRNDPSSAPSFDWSRFFSSAAQTGSRYAVHDLQSGSPGGGAGGMFNLGSNLLHSMAAASGGSLGSTLSAASHFADLPHSGFSVPLGDSGKGASGPALDLHLSGLAGGGIGGMFHGSAGASDPMQGSFSGTGGGMGSAGSMFGNNTGMNGNMSEGMNSFGSGTGGGGGGQHGGGGHGGGGYTPSVSVRLKF